MFEVGKRYEIRTTDSGCPSEGITYRYGEVVDYQAPLLKLREDDGKEMIVNTSSPLFVGAKLRPPVSGGRDLVGELLKAVEDEEAGKEPQPAS